MQFGWDSADAIEDSKAAVTSPIEPATYEHLYGNELQFFESLFNGSFNESFDYLTSNELSSEAISTSYDSSSGDEFNPYVKNEPTSPNDCFSASPSSPGESSGPSSPETYSSVETINPASLLSLPTQKPQQAPLIQDIKKGNKRARIPASIGAAPINAPPEEERQVKRQRRLIKNRESAQKSRLRKKMNIEELEAKVNAANAISEQLMTENKALKDEINLLTRFINKTPGLAEEVARNRPKSAVTPIRNVKAAGVCLLVVLFSFGLFVNNVQQMGSKGPALPFEAGTREPIPEVVPFGGERRYSRMLKSFRDAESPMVSGMNEGFNDLTEIYPKRRLPPLDYETQPDEKVGTELTTYKKIKVEQEEMDHVDALSFEGYQQKGYIPITHVPGGIVPEVVLDHLNVMSTIGHRNDTGAVATGETE